jgi:hypothetical protein
MSRILSLIRTVVIACAVLYGLEAWLAAHESTHPDVVPLVAGFTEPVSVAGVSYVPEVLAADIGPDEVAAQEEVDAGPVDTIDANDGEKSAHLKGYVTTLPDRDAASGRDSSVYAAGLRESTYDDEDDTDDDSEDAWDDGDPDIAGNWDEIAVTGADEL